MFEFLHALVTLIVDGDYTGALYPVLGEEDSPIVDFILTMTGR